ncbi:GDYXXLXY domain-containing protein [Microbacteriaceae bacterium 4G12]
MNRKKGLVILFICCQLLILGSMTGIRYYTKWYGKEIVLMTEPIPFEYVSRQKYVSLSYPISKIPFSKWVGDDKPHSREKVYVLLRKEAKEYGVVGVTREKITPKNENEVVLLGKYDYEINNDMHITYGLEKYRLSNEDSHINRQQALQVHIKVSKYHQCITSIEAKKE